MFVNIFQVYVVAKIKQTHLLWLFLTLLIFLNILLELGVYYRLSQQPPDDNGMVIRFPLKQESYIHANPIYNKDTDEKPLILSCDGSVDGYVNSFKDIKVIINSTTLLIYNYQVFTHRNV